MGLAIIPEQYIDQFGSIPNANYYYIEEKYDYKWTVAAAYYKGGYLSSAVRKFLSMLDEIFGDPAETGQTGRFVSSVGV